jgi:phage gp46-like protein
VIPREGVGDIALKWSNGVIDLVLEDDDVLTDEGLRTAVLLSLFVDRRAEDDDPLPGSDDDRRGWWADEFSDVEGDRIGSRLWLLDRAKRTADVVPRTEELAREALAWMIEDRVAASVDVAVEVDGDIRYLNVTIERPSGDRANFRFAAAWDAEAARAV